MLFVSIIISKTAITIHDFKLITILRLIKNAVAIRTIPETATRMVGFIILINGINKEYWNKNKEAIMPFFASMLFFVIFKVDSI